MRPVRVIPVVLGVVIAGVWLVVTVGSPERPPPQVTESVHERVGDFDLNRQVERLAMSLRTAPQPRHPARNPFEFTTRPQPPVLVKSDAPQPQVEQKNPPPEVMPVLAGIAENRTAEGPQRIAIISYQGDVHLLKLGEILRSRFRLDQLEAELIVLHDLQRDSSLTLVLK